MNNGLSYRLAVYGQRQLYLSRMNATKKQILINHAEITLNFGDAKIGKRGLIELIKTQSRITGDDGFSVGSCR